MKDEVAYLEQHGQVRTCPNCGGNPHFPKSYVKYSFLCRVCNEAWRFRRLIEHKDMPAWWYYKNKTKNVPGQMARID